MQLVRIDLIAGRGKARFTAISAAIQCALSETLDVPQRMSSIDGRRRQRVIAAPSTMPNFAELPAALAGTGSEKEAT